MIKQPLQTPFPPSLHLPQAQKEGGSEFKYGQIMTDKCKTEIATIRLMELSGDAQGCILCFFHFLQDWERFLISRVSGVAHGEKNGIMVELRQLAHCANEALFKQQVKQWCVCWLCSLHSAPDGAANCATPCLQLAAWYRKHQRLHRPVVKYMKEHWERDAERWARWGPGRQAAGVADMEQDTNNLAERSFQSLKYTDLGRNAQSTITQLVDVILTKTVPRYMQQRGQQLVGRASSDQVQMSLRIQRAVEQLVRSGAVVAEEQGSSYGRVAVTGDCGGVIVYLGDMSCTCSYSGELAGGPVV